MKLQLISTDLDGNETCVPIALDAGDWALFHYLQQQYIRKRTQFSKVPKSDELMAAIIRDGLEIVSYRILHSELPVK